MFIFYVSFGLGNQVQAQSNVLANDLIVEEIDEVSEGIDTSLEDDDSDIQRVRYVTIDPDAPGLSLILSLFDDTIVDADQTGVQTQGDARIWSGQVTLVSGGSPSLILPDEGSNDVSIGVDISSNIVSGSVYLDDYFYDIRFKEDADAGPVYAIVEYLSMDVLFPDVDDTITLEDDLLTGNSNFAGDVCAPANTCGTRTVNVMIIWTSAAQAKMGGLASAKTKAATAVAGMQTALTASGISHTVQLVHTQEFASITEGANLNADLQSVTSNAAVAALRTTHGADLVGLVSDQTGCGLGWTPSGNMLDPGQGFMAMSPGCVHGRLVAHEFGHTMGLHHDLYVTTNNTPCAWGKGYVNQSATGTNPNGDPNAWVTVMAYWNQLVTTAAANGLPGLNTGIASTPLRYSNPNQTITGHPAGVIRTSPTNPADAAYHLNRSMCVVANYAGPTLPVELTSFDAKVLQGNTILLDWATATEDNNSGFDIEHSAYGEEFVSLAFVDGYGSTTESQNYSFETSQLSPGSHRFRLKQIDFDGKSEYHEIVEVDVSLPGAFVLEPVYPNPFNPTASFNFFVGMKQNVEVSLYNSVGQKVAELFSGVATASNKYSVSIDGSNLSSGMYLVQMNGLNFNASQKVILQK